ncbi:hypothetical protein F5Y10DRAFT_92216 [Nemania abortiva]|nr:hypothetical protein F5Y10DRAFT_92216 [Nemania abortiva]
MPAMTKEGNEIEASASLLVLLLVLFAAMKATALAAIGTGAMGRVPSRVCRLGYKALVSVADVIPLAWLRHAPSRVNSMLLGVAFLYQFPVVSSLPVSSEDSTAYIAMKSYELTRSSFLIMATMGAIMTTLALINSVIDIVRCCSKRRTYESKLSELPRNPINCESSAAAHAALGQHVSDDALDPDSGQELSPISEAPAATDADQQPEQ